MAWRIVDPEQERAKREIRLRIGRGRRRIEQRIRAFQHRGRQLLSWRTYVRRLPGYAVLGALGAGLVLSAGMGRRRLAGWLGLRLLRRASNRLGRVVWREIERLWADSTPKKRKRGHATFSQNRGNDCA